MIEFNGETLKVGNLHSHLALRGGELQAQRQYFWGLQGVSEIVSFPTFWMAECEVWLNDSSFTSVTALTAYRDTLLVMKGDHGELIEKHADDTVSESWLEATFEGFEELPLAGHQIPGPVQDATGVLNNTWFTRGIMRWTLLSSTRGAA